MSYFSSYLLGSSSVTSLDGRAVTSTAISVTWNLPQCPNGVISEYIVYYDQSDTRRTSNINTDGFNSVRVPSNTFEYVISGLTPFESYAILVQAVVAPAGRNELLGDIDVELLIRTHSTTDDPPTPPSDAFTQSPSSSRVSYLIGDPLDIDTGIVM